MTTLLFQDLFLVDQLSVIMLALILFLSMCVLKFAKHYLEGDRKQQSFFATTSLLILAMTMLVTADHMALFFAAWVSCNLLLVKLMVHKGKWKAAKSSGLVALATFSVGFVTLGIGLILLNLHYETASIHAIISSTKGFSASVKLALILFVITTMTQSAIWPFHKWLLSSLNSPTPVSAIMHAGLVNGGGFLLARFAPILLIETSILNIILVVGAISAVVGTLWKLMQHDIKRMLACSTLGQMGFMLVQCGLGMFPAAVAHLCWHGMFKAYLFLASGSFIQERRKDFIKHPTKQIIIMSLLCGLVGSFCFALASNKAWLSANTSFFLVVVAFIGSSQFSLALLQVGSYKRLPVALITTAVSGLVYGLNVWVIEKLLDPLGMMIELQMTAIHWGILIISVAVWFVFAFKVKTISAGNMPGWMRKIYVYMLNASQPHRSTVTTFRNYYSY